MFKSQKALLITTLVIYVSYLWGFSYVFNLEYGLIFYILAVMAGMAFYAFVSDYYPQTEAMEMTESPSENAKYIEDGPYSWASLGAIAMLLLSVTPLLITMYVNQCGSGHVSWILQALIFLAGYILQFVTLGIYKACDSISISSEIWYRDFSVRSASSKTTMDDVMKSLASLDDIMSGRISKEIYAEAESIVRNVLIKQLGCKDSEITDDARLCGYLGADELDIIEIEDAVSARLKAKYGYDLVDLEHHHNESDVVRQYVDLVYLSISRGPDYYSKQENLGKYGTELLAILRTVADCKELVAGAINYIKKYKGR